MKEIYTDFIYIDGVKKFTNGMLVRAFLIEDQQKLAIRPKQGSLSGVAVTFEQIKEIRCWASNGEYFMQTTYTPKNLPEEAEYILLKLNAPPTSKATAFFEYI